MKKSDAATDVDSRSAIEMEAINAKPKPKLNNPNYFRAWPEPCGLP
jgi:hypothetical protein